MSNFLTTNKNLELLDEDVNLSKAMREHIAHHVNNPLAIINGTLHMLKNGSDLNGSIETIQRASNRIRDYVKHLETLVNKGE